MLIRSFWVGKKVHQVGMTNFTELIHNILKNDYYPEGNQENRRPEQILKVSDFNFFRTLMHLSQIS